MRRRHAVNRFQLLKISSIIFFLTNLDGTGVFCHFIKTAGRHARLRINNALYRE